ncbi:response regulator receiver domain protein [Bacteriovorax sp. BAL6_X]|uniref:response regulator n=1 Tax=Bacteriovorax sp. BAL6_X TaxID=1201290 RepID=UPI0003868612|nr:response regulator [Bacteriovorax sp. BAL6_X]EPZ49325.1 response regulator receiver domain protein [Bacteriovorax sp. BAL6_X]
MAMSPSKNTLTPKKPSILIVDDEEKICFLIKTFLEQTGAFRNIVTADSVSVALLKLRNEEFDLVIIDYKLPDKDGTYFIDIASKSMKYQKMKYLLISGFLDNRSMVSVINSGVTNVLVKPFSRDDLVDKVFNLLKLSK